MAWRARLVGADLEQAPPNGLLLAADGTTLYTAGGSYIETGDRFLRAFDTSSTVLKWKAKLKAGVVGLALLDDRVAAACDDGVVRTYTAGDGAPRATVQIMEPAEKDRAPVGGIAADIRGGLLVTWVQDHTASVSWISAAGNALAVDGGVDLILSSVPGFRNEQRWLESC